MKSKFLLGIAIWIMTTACAEKAERNATENISIKKADANRGINSVESAFAYHFALLDSVLEKKYNGQPHRIREAMIFMDTTTGIPAKGDGTPLGWFYDEITAAQYQKWKQWYTKNKDHLKWDEASQRIVREK